MSAERLYTPELLALAVELAGYPQLDSASCSGEARSPACGSTLAMQLMLEPDGRIARVGMRVRACAVGQAAAAIFARHAAGRSAAQIYGTRAAIEGWLSSPHADLPDWPDLSLIAAARSFPGRHGAMLLPWKAAAAALSNGHDQG